MLPNVSVPLDEWRRSTWLYLCMESYLEKFTVQQPKSNSKMMQGLYRPCLGTEKRISLVFFLPHLLSLHTTKQLLPHTHAACFSSLCFPICLLLFFLSYSSFPSRSTELLELSSSFLSHPLFFLFIIRLILHVQSPKKRSGIRRTPLARGRLRNEREGCKHFLVNNFHSVVEMHECWQHSQTLFF